MIMENRNDISLFICDDNLGKLAKLLRASGFDTLFFREISDGDLIARALADNRYIITRDRKLSFKGADPEMMILIESDNPDEQLMYVLAQLGLKPARNNWLTRCLDCNTILKEVPREDYADRIPPYVFKTLNEFYKCENCDKLFWKGTHHQRMVERLSRIIND